MLEQQLEHFCVAELIGDLDNASVGDVGIGARFKKHASDLDRAVLYRTFESRVALAIRLPTFPNIVGLRALFEEKGHNVPMPLGARLQKRGLTCEIAAGGSGIDGD